jgi:hypothetical protein
MEVPVESIFDAVKDNVVVQWFLVVMFILLVGTNTAARIKGPLGDLARWVSKVGESRDNREAAERRRARQRLLQEAKEGREYIEGEMKDLKEKVEDLINHREAMENLVNNHLSWDYDRRRQLIELGVSNAEIPPAPPLRVPLPGDGQELSPA